MDVAKGLDFGAKVRCGCTAFTLFRNVRMYDTDVRNGDNDIGLHVLSCVFAVHGAAMVAACSQEALRAINNLLQFIRSLRHMVLHLCAQLWGRVAGRAVVEAR